MIIISFPHAEIARAAITIARERNPAILTMCRARFPHEAAMLRKLDPDNTIKPIETLRGRGYRFSLPRATA